MATVWRAWQLYGGCGNSMVGVTALWGYGNSIGVWLPCGVYRGVAFYGWCGEGMISLQIIALMTVMLRRPVVARTARRAILRAVM